jgi:hypothetical protein
VGKFVVELVNVLEIERDKKSHVRRKDFEGCYLSGSFKNTS